MEIALVTGSTGFIGSHLCRVLLDRGYQVRAFHRPTSRLQLLEGLPVEHVSGDLTRPETLVEALQGVDFLFHAAAMLGGNEKPGQMYTVNVEGTRSLLKAALQNAVKKVVYTSSVAAMGVPQRPVSDQTGPLAIDENHSWNYLAEFWPYGYAKYLAELEVQKSVAEGLDVVVVNPTLVYGPGDLYKQANSLVVQIAQRKVPILVEGGVNIVHIDDVIEGHIAALQYGKTGERYILGSENLTLPELIYLCAEIANVPAPENMVPAWLLRAVSGPLSLFQPFVTAPVGLSMLRMAGSYFFFDYRKAMHDLRWQPRFGARQALMDAYTWFRQQGVV